MGQDSDSSVTGWFQPRDPFGGEVVVMPKAAVIWRLDWDWRICCQESFHLALPHGPAKEMLLSWHMAATSPPKERQESHCKTQCLCWPSLGITRHYFCNVMLVAQASTIQFGRGLHKGVNTSRWGHRRVLEASYCTHYTGPTSLPWLMLFSPRGLPLLPQLVLMW